MRSALTPQEFTMNPYPNPMKTLLRSIPVMVLCAGWAFADLAADLADFESQKKSLQAEIKKLDQRLRETDSLSKEEIRRTQVLQERYQMDLQRRRSELDSLQVKMQNQAGELQRERNKQANFQSKTENLVAFRKALSQNLATQAQELENQTAQSLPWDRESRVERIQALRRDLESGTATPEEGFSRLRALYTEEIRFGDEVVLASRPLVRKDGETINARVLRIGNQWMVYHDDEALRFGVLQRQTDSSGTVQYDWRESLSFEERQAVKLAIDVKLARKPPQMVSLPLSVSVSAPEARP